MKIRLIASLIVVFIFLIQGCRQSSDLNPEDYFSGQQLILARAIESGNMDEVKKFLPKTDLNKPGQHDMTLLFWALTNTPYDKKTQPRLHIVTELIKAGADPLQPRPNGKSSPAEFVLMADSGDWIKAMLDGGLSPNAKDYVFNKPIIFQTLEAKNTETLKAMLDRGSNIDITDSLGETLLINAFDFHSYDHVFLLLERGADPDIRADNGWALGNQLQRFLERAKKDSDEYKNLIAIKESLIRHGGKWPPEPVKRGIE
ncbi:TPA: ankyrin repeat domain-containing protein [Enterobacter cloacae]|uniref:ankyrin repeat domain-containing protein n=1 Tax=Enterobacter cloacae TaxID=550 RepID=UPI001CC718A9|nr:ankyrin repeat domain-containing protein [Enterobacter cloacae]MBZ5208159.1 ankyrin repeat domain-containing protein [Enterobacter cloacae subsp. cloacae]MEA3724631.1 ankyrin repeat domain-containing protein [Enterobacter cloacae]MEA3728419.1 ankyrin repeat domain-containing protein [Enterobacter cloacae]MEA3737868.1 ankyrin repeat domain-containing protein [Enterobacter cloacae]MEA3754138.1 ankyrin repeat domain-containing protein [Enterobacter cloacae]